MRNFFKNPWGSNTKIESRRQIIELLDTDEDKVINQYRRYLNYINNVKKGLIQRSESVIRHTKEKYIRELQLR
jgi:hypothetical protein